MTMTTKAPYERARCAKRASTVAVLLAAAIVALAACSPKKDNSQAASDAPHNVTLTSEQMRHIRLYTVTPSRFHKTIETSGAVDFDNDQATSVISPISGPVTRLLVSPGDKVKKGAPLAMVDSSDFAAATSAYSKALATARNARRLADMDKDLLEHNGVSQREADQARTDAVNAEADRDAALQTLASLNVDPKLIKDIQQGRPLSHIEGMIRAPISGTVAERLITPGQLLQAGTTPAFTIADLSRVWVMAQVFGPDLSAIDVGDRAEIETGMSSHNPSGKVENISTVVSPDTRSVVVRVAVDNPQDILKKQMYVRVLIHSRQESNGFLVPVSAILRDDENLPFVYIVQRDGSFARQHVTLGYRANDRYHIPSGLKAGSRIVVDGGLFVQFMQSQ
jgi:cobalt-zinc-cadmium efflux system membrane fusion protein